MDEINDANLQTLILAEDTYVSPVSLWEMAIKHRIGKLALPSEEVESVIRQQGFAWLAVQPSHAQAVFAFAAAASRPFWSAADRSGCRKEFVSSPVTRFSRATCPTRPF